MCMVTLVCHYIFYKLNMGFFNLEVFYMEIIREEMSWIQANKPFMFYTSDCECSLHWEDEGWTTCVWVPGGRSSRSCHGCLAQTVL